eukprot:GHVU01125538.1.p1 GENE.GHVU01125538.1~~GHVU01125538.1.p1  ORF type:complete len:304 (-),score=48.12 GHVU01125538.1:344-1255(-)
MAGLPPGAGGAEELVGSQYRRQGRRREGGDRHPLYRGLPSNLQPPAATTDPPRGSDGDDAVGVLVEALQSQSHPLGRQPRQQLDQIEAGEKGGAALRLDYPKSQGPSTAGRRGRGPRKVRYTQQQLRKKGLLDLSTDRIDVDLCEQMHALWRQYIQQLLGFSQGGAEKAMRLAQADLRGAYMRVVKSTTPSVVAVEGYCVSETEGSVVLFCPKDGKLRTIVKKVALFAVGISTSELQPNEDEQRRVSQRSPSAEDVASRVIANPANCGVATAVEEVLVHGQHFVFRPAERSKVKFKAKSSIAM